MKVYVKKEDTDSNIPRFIITILFLVVPLIIFSFYFGNGSFMDALKSMGDAIIFAAIFFCFGLYFLYALFKKPKFYRCVLVEKKEEVYNGENITYMVFDQFDEETGTRAENYNYCYTIGSNDLVVGKFYNLAIKEYNWEPISVEEYNESGVRNKPFKLPFNPLLVAFLLIIIGNIGLGVLGILTYPEYTYIYVIWIFVFTLALFGLLKLLLKK